MLITLVALTVLMISAVALVRSFNASTVLAGSMAFKRNSVNVGERGFDRAAYQVLNNISDLGATTPSYNYSAQILTSDSRGIPNVLLSDTAFATAGMNANLDFASGVSSNEKIRYVIDRQCSETGAGTLQTCKSGPSTSASKLSSSAGTYDLWKKKPTGGSGGGGWPLRVTVRVQDSVTNEVTFLQATLVPN